LDGEDSGELKDEYLKIADVYFTREYFRNGKYPVKLFNLTGVRRLVPPYYKRYPDKVFNLSFGIIPFDYNSRDINPEKAKNVFFAGNVTSEIRKQLKKTIISSGNTYLSNILNMDDYVMEVRMHACIALPTMKQNSLNPSP
jgi:hypothetical protein